MNYKEKSKIHVVPTVKLKSNKITYIPVKELKYSYIINDKFLKMPKSVKAINKIRGGSLFELVSTLIIIAIFCQVIGFRSEVRGFVANNKQNYEYKIDKSNPFQPPGSNLNYPPGYHLGGSRKRYNSNLRVIPPASMPN